MVSFPWRESEEEEMVVMVMVMGVMGAVEGRQSRRRMNDGMRCLLIFPMTSYLITLVS